MTSLNVLTDTLVLKRFFKNQCWAKTKRERTDIHFPSNQFLGDLLNILLARWKY